MLPLPPRIVDYAMPDANAAAAFAYVTPLRR